MQDDKNKKERLLEEIQRILEQHKDTDRVGVQNYLQQCSGNITTHDKKF